MHRSRVYFRHRAPEDRHGLFRLDPPKPFAPALEPGDHLRFVLRANATVARKAEGKPSATGRMRGGRCDVVMDALHAVPKAERAAVRRDLLPAVSAEWLRVQGGKHGFAVVGRAAPHEPESGSPLLPVAPEVTGYRVMRIDRGRRRPPMELGVLDLEGALVVTAPELFVPALAKGFGRSKAFGCGLMLVRRAARPG